MKIYRNNLELYFDNVRDINDKRKKISKAVFSYTDNSGNEYRRSFKSIPFTPEQTFWFNAPLEITI